MISKIRTDCCISSYSSPVLLGWEANLVGDDFYIFHEKRLRSNLTPPWDVSTHTEDSVRANT